MEFLITYDLRKDRDYENLYRALARMGAHPILESVWIVRAMTFTDEIFNQLSRIIDVDDRLLVVAIEPTNQSSVNLLNSFNVLK